MRWFSIALLTLLPWVPADSEEGRGIAVISVGGEDLDIGTFHFLGIGIDKYQDRELELQTAVKGATDLRDLLVKEFAFAKEQSRLLLDAQASSDAIVGALRSLAQTAGENDSVLIYYAGHGLLDQVEKIGSWVPWDATFKTPAKWISNTRILGLLKAMKARHVLLISDSCFSGDFFRGDRDLVVPKITDSSVRRAFTRMSRKAMTAGGLEPVADQGMRGHSVYTGRLLKALAEVPDPYVIPEQVHDRLKKAVSANAAQNPLYGFLHGAGGEPDGSFVFFRSGTKGMDAALRAKLKRIDEMKKLDSAAAEKARRQQEEIARKQVEMAAMDKQIAALQIKLGAGGGQSDLDAMYAIVQEKERKAKELDELRQKAEAELRAREEALAAARRKQEEDRRRRFESDYGKYHTIAASEYATDGFKAQAWKILCRNWGVPEDTPVGKALTYEGGKVQVGESAPVGARLGGGRPGETFKNTIGMELVLMPAGEFEMGSNDGDRDEKPVHTVKITKPFYLSTTEVTQAQYEAVMGTNPSRFKGPDLPVEEVSWEVAMEFCKKLSAKENKPYRLPTEAEWEYACRAGTKTNYCFGNNEDDLGDYAWYDKNAGKQTHPVGQKKPNAWGLYDMHGNVYEWCADWYGDYPGETLIDPAGPTTGVIRVLRGGGWLSGARYCRSAYRLRFGPGFRYYSLGFRLALSRVQRR